ncbi:hypothetical protein F4778DRAFT_742506 [Xylariomycetidae sp. FL2044]|nr:hypothetical protein F4778DRAFT_742506 [Xylariomycetidae sp. FL2044]
MDMGGGIMDFLQRYREYDTQRENTHEFIRDLMIYAQHVESTLGQEIETLRQQLRDKHLDFEDAVKSRREFQQRLADVETRMGYVSQDNDNLKNKNPYVLVLIDGDGLIFKDALIKQGVEGGRKAANELWQAVADQCSHADETEIIVKIAANLSGLAKALKREGAVDNEFDLKDFVAGFNRAQAYFDFVDVGYGKERADSKIQESTRFHLRNYNCKQILLGISHDAGYAPFLDQIIRNDSTKQRLTILEGYPTVREIVTIGLNTLSFQSIFRSEKLLARPPSVQGPPSMSTLSSVSPAGMSYATITQKASPPPQLILPLAPRTVNSPAVRASKQPAWNPGPRGIDPPIPINQNALDNIKKRKDSSKLCNNHYLRGPCSKGDDCCFEHDYKPSKDEKNAIAFLARLNPCTNGQDCEVDNCIYGHHCPSVVNGLCVHPYCKFRADEHPPGTKFKHSRSSDS